jgi:hypothetical protein
MSIVMKNFLLPIIVLVYGILGSCYSLASNTLDPLEKESGRKVIPLKSSISLRDTRSVKDKVKMFEEFSNSSSPKRLPLKLCEQKQAESLRISSPGHVKKISKFFQRKKSKEQLLLISQGQTTFSSSGSSPSSMFFSPSPKSPRNLYNRLVRSRTGTQDSLEELSKEASRKGKKQEKGSRSRSPKDFELSAPRVNVALTKQHTLNPENIEKDWEDRIKYFTMVKKTIEEHIKTGTINQTDEKYAYVLKGDLEQLEEMYVKGMGYLQGKHSLRKQDPMMVASHIQNMGNLLKTVGSEIYWVTGTGSLTIYELKLFETKLEDAKKRQADVNGEELSSFSKICITHPSPTRRRAYTTKGGVSH